MRLIDALAPWTKRDDGAKPVVRRVLDRAFLFTPGFSEIFAVDPRALDDERLADRARRDAEELARAGWLVAAMPRPALRMLVLTIDTTCNLACTYCNVTQGTYNRPRVRMSAETARLAIERLMPENERFDLGFFGGEPMLGWETIVETTRWVKEHRPMARLLMVTNGTLVDEEKARFLAQNHVHVTVSIDGDAETHDRHRVDRAGRGSHARVVAGIDLLQRAGVELLLRGTYAPAPARLHERVEALAAIGGRRLPVLVEPLHGADDTHGEETRASFDLAARDGVVPEPLVGVVGAVLRGAHGNDTSCTAGRDVIVLPDGDVHPCHVAADRAVERIGSLLDDRPRWLARWSEVRERWTALPRKCEPCWANGLCGHGCPMQRVRDGAPSDAACTWSMDRLDFGAFFADTLDADALHAVAMKSATAQDASAIAAGILVREAFRGEGRALRPLSFPTRAPS